MKKKETKKEEVLPPETVEESEVKEVENPFNPNQQRVVFPKLLVKKIVSYHSGTILADKEPIIEISDEKYQEVIQLFQKNAVNDLLPSTALLDLMIQLGSFGNDRAYLQSVINHKLQSVFNPQNTISPPPPPTAGTVGGNLTNTLSGTLAGSGDATLQASFLEESFTEQKFLQFFLLFYAPAFYYGQRLRLYAGRGEKEEVKQLLYRQCSVNSANGEGLTALHIAAENNQVEIIDLLIQTAGISNGPGSSGVIVNAQDKYGWTPLHSAVHNGHQPVVVKLLSLPEIDLNVVNNMGKTALHLGCAQNRGLIVTKLLAAGASLQSVDKRGMTPLHETAYRGRIPLYQELLRDPRADPNLKDDLGKLASDYITPDEII